MHMLTHPACFVIAAAATQPVAAAVPSSFTLLGDDEEEGETPTLAHHSCWPVQACMLLLGPLTSTCVAVLFPVADLEEEQEDLSLATQFNSTT
jgi:hypothetical protein